MSLTQDCRQFYELRDRRSVEYLGRAIGDLAPVYVATDATTTGTAAGQLALLALANQLARVCRRISFALPAPGAPVLVNTPFPGNTLGELLLTTARGIDPCGDFRIGTRPAGRSVSIGLGIDVGNGFDWYIGADRAVAFLRRRAVGFSDVPASLRGAALASCLGCAAVFRQQLGLPVVERVLSAWNYAEGDAAAFGPESLDAVDVGRVLMVGAGAVGSALAFWLHAFGVRGDGWAVLDRDVVKLHNTNRGLVFTASHAGWPKGSKVNKAKLVAPLIPGALACDSWYHECADIGGRQFDVILALANNHDVRERLTQRHAAISLQATTGENWLSQLHRHILGRDGCIWCRTGEVKAPLFGCSSAQVAQPDGSQSDAALPFLSAASGLMLATALQRLASGELHGDLANCWSWDFGSECRMTPTPAVRCCRDECALIQPVHVRQQLTRDTRWTSLVR